MKKYIILLTLIISACTSNNNSNNEPTVDEFISKEVDIGIPNVSALGIFETPDSLVFTPNLSPTNQVLTQSIRLKNSSASSVPLNLSISAPFSIKINRCGSSIAAGASCSITIQVSSRGLYNGILNSSLIINEVPMALSAEIEGKLDPDIAGVANLQMQLDSPFSPINGKSLRVLTIKNIGDGTATNVGLQSLPPQFTLWINRCPSSLKPNTSCSMTIAFKNFRSGGEVQFGTVLSLRSGLNQDVIYSLDLRTGQLPDNNGPSPFINSVGMRQVQNSSTASPVTYNTRLSFTQDAGQPLWETVSITNSEIEGSSIDFTIGSGATQTVNAQGGLDFVLDFTDYSSSIYEGVPVSLTFTDATGQVVNNQTVIVTAPDFVAIGPGIITIWIRENPAIQVASITDIQVLIGGELLSLGPPLEETDRAGKRNTVVTFGDYGDEYPVGSNLTVIVFRSDDTITEYTIPVTPY